MSMDDSTINSAATWAAFQEGRAGWGDWVESRLSERFGEEREFVRSVLGEVIGTLADDLRNEFNKALTSLRAQRSLKWPEHTMEAFAIVRSMLSP